MIIKGLSSFSLRKKPLLPTKLLGFDAYLIIRERGRVVVDQELLSPFAGLLVRSPAL